MLFEIRIVGVTDHDCRRALHPDDFLQLPTPQHAVENALDVTYGSGESHAITNQNIDRQITEIRMSRPRFDRYIFQWNTDEVNRLADTQASCFSLFREVEFLPVVAQETTDRNISSHRIC